MRAVIALPSGYRIPEHKAKDDLEF